MKFTKFAINNYKAIKTAMVDLSKEGLVLLLGINESGKTSVLRAIESFDRTNDPSDDFYRTRFFKSIRNKKELNSAASISAEIFIENKDKQKFSEIFTEQVKDTEEKAVKGISKLTITRHFEYENAEFKKEFYTLSSDVVVLLKDTSETNQNTLAQKILTICPSIQYFEDFKDQIPDFISLTPGVEHHNADWASTVEGLFYHADKNVSVQQFESLQDENARNTVLNKVNLSLNRQFTNRWNKKFKGIKTIHKVDLVYDKEKKLFTFKVTGSDKSTVFEVDERSKGALWYFTFLLKTEFRKRKLRAEQGKTLYLIDEPGSNLHSSAQTNMVTDFRTLASDSNVIYTTHSQYLIDKENLTNVYIVEYVRSRVNVQKYQDYLQGTRIQTSFYQPIIDALEIQPFALDSPWEKVLIVEGIYDYCGFKLMFEKILKKKLDFTILPGTGASGHSTLISLHIGWGATMYVLLDNDDEGRNCANRYKDQFPVIRESIDTLPSKSTSDVVFEDLLSSNDKRELLGIAGFDPSKPTKKAVQQSIADVLYSPKLTTKLSSKLEQKTKNTFEAIYNVTVSKLG